MQRDFFLSEILGTHVSSNDGKSVGRIWDVLLSGVSSPDFEVVGLLTKKQKFIPSACLRGLDLHENGQLSRKFTLCMSMDEFEKTPPFEEIRRERDTVKLRSDLLDKQIIDTKGKRVVRVNDLVLGWEAEKAEICIQSVDISTGSMVRRLFGNGFFRFMGRGVGSWFTARTIPWEYVALLEGGKESLKIKLKVHEKLVKMHPADIADIIEDLGTVDSKMVLDNLDPDTAAKAFTELDQKVQIALIDELSPEEGADIVEEMPPDEAADLLGDLSEKRQEEILKQIDEDEAENIKQLMVYPDESAGGLMTTDYLSMDHETRLQDVFYKIKDLEEDVLENLHNIFLVSGEERYVGTVPLARVFFNIAQNPFGTARLNDLINESTNPASIEVDEDVEEVLERFDKYNLSALPVVDDKSELKGIITHDDIVALLVERTEKS